MLQNPTPDITSLATDSVQVSGVTVPASRASAERRWSFPALSAGWKTGFAAVALLTLAGCGASGEETPTATPSPTEAPAVTWYKDIEPLVNQVCARCHMAGGVAPSQFSDYETASERAATLAAYVTSGYMPPKSADPTCHDYQYSERMTLTDEQRQLFATWSELGAPKGDPATAPAPVVYEDSLTDVDEVLRLPKVHYPTFDASGNQYACYVVEANRPETVFLTAFDAAIDRGEIVHHVVLYKGHFPEGETPTDLTQGWDCMTGTTGDWSMLGAWAPGGGPVILPDGLGVRVDPADMLVLQIHYFRSFDGADQVGDQSGYKLRMEPMVDHELYYLPFGPTDFLIPAGNAEYSAAETFVMPPGYGTLRVYGIFPHMHLLGTRYHYEMISRGRSTCLLDGPWDFHNQQTYMFREPIEVNVGDSASFGCTWNNSDSNPNQVNNPLVDVGYGERTQEEMCFGFTLATLY